MISCYSLGFKTQIYIFVCAAKFIPSYIYSEIFILLLKQDCDIPEAILPDPFNQSCLTSNADLPIDISSSNESNSLSSSHLCPSFSPRFSRESAFAEAKIDQFSVPLSTGTPYESDSTLNQELDSERTSPESSKSSINQNNVEECQPIPACSLVGNERTPMKILSESELMLETPAQPTPKRSVPITEDKHKKMTEQESLVLNLTVKRSLDFSTLPGAEMPSDLISGSIEHHELNMERKTISNEDHVNADVFPNEVPFITWEVLRCFTFRKATKNFLMLMSNFILSTQ